METSKASVPSQQRRTGSPGDEVAERVDVSFEGFSFLREIGSKQGHQLRAWTRWRCWKLEGRGEGVQKGQSAG